MLALFSLYPFKAVDKIILLEGGWELNHSACFCSPSPALDNRQDNRSQVRERAGVRVCYEYTCHAYHS